MTSVQLKALCKEYGLKVSGKKVDLQERLREHLLKVPQVQTTKDEFDDMSDDELRQSLAVRGMDDSGDRSELLQRVREDIQFVNDLEAALPTDSTGHKTIMEALTAAASSGGVAQEILSSIKSKEMEETKFVDITISSIGMQAIKHTAGGAPSVTADVLRQLAGDPFEDPPRYGSVSKFSELCVPLASSADFCSCPFRPMSFLEVGKKAMMLALGCIVCVPLVLSIR
jgi:hypothetical protein